MIYFLHVPKTAGTSMRQLFTAGLAADELAYVYLPPDGLELEQLYALPRPHIERLKLLFGHYHYGVHKALRRPGTYVTCLRATASRLTSNYRQHKRAGFVGEMGLLDYFQSLQPLDMDNYTVRLLAGIGQSLPFGAVNTAHLRLARHNLLHGIAAFGLYEYLPETVACFRTVLGIGETGLGEENITPDEHRAETIPAREIEAVTAHNALDEALYQFARGQFLARLRGAAWRG